ncbi:MAG TPA: F0F1 ATP synthase subunit B [Candidatus Omnitrophota bacterium]|nr:F0F1 ATP synthase subunit B [Candidatus Omnitrophota bacterium]
MSDSLIREIIVQLAGFVVAFWILKRFAWKPILALLDERKRRIAEGFDDLEKSKAELEKLRNEYQARLDRIEDECRLKIQEAIAEGKKDAQGIREKARNEAGQILAKAQNDIELEVDKATVEMKEKMVNLVILSTERLLKREMSKETQKTLVSGILTELEKESEG